MPALPSGTITFLFSDLESSTRAWLRNPEGMGAALARHDALIEQLVADHDGHVVRPRGEGDSRFAVFARASDAVAAACAIQVAFVGEVWPLTEPLQVRIAVHTGEADLRLGDYYGPAVNHCARLRAVAHGGQVLVSAVTADLVREALSPEVSLRDVGQHQLKDLDQSERVWQLVHPKLQAEFPPLTSLNPKRNNLPNQLSSFVGRAREIAEVRGLLGSVRLLTLTGPGGIGKTRLALRVATESQANYHDGVWLVRLEALADPDLVTKTTASVLAVHEQPGRALLETLADAVGARQMLIVLDNCEHLAQACAELADALLEKCPHLQILATSREALGVRGEVAWSLRPLGLPIADQHVALADSEAGRLFFERAAAAKSGFAVNDQSAAAVAQVCRRLDGLPLAIELAATRVKTLTVEQLAQRLDDRLGLLIGGSRTALPRQQTLVATIEWSYDLLSESDRILFRRLGVFAGGWTLEAAELVCSGVAIASEEVLDGLCSLVDKSLVSTEERDRDTRYRLLETIRQYARQRLVASGEAGAVRRRHTEHFLALAEQAEPELRGGRQVWWLDRLELEHDNLRAALSWCVENDEAELGLRLGGALWRFWEIRGHLKEGRERLKEVLALKPAGGDQSLRTGPRAAALNAAGNLALHQGDYGLARALHSESLAIKREIADRPGIAASLSNLGLLAKIDGAYELARSYYEESLTIRQGLGDQWGIAVVFNNLGRLAEQQGNHPLARSNHEESLRICRETGDRRGIASSLLNLGNVAAKLRDYPGARSLYESSLAVSRELGNKEYIAETMEGFAVLAAAEAQPERALRLAGAAARLRDSIGAPLPSADLEALERALDPARQMLSTEASTTAYSEGQILSLEDALDYECQLRPTIPRAAAQR